MIKKIFYKIVNKIFLMIYNFFWRISYRKKKIYIERKVYFKNAVFEGKNKIYKFSDVSDSKIGIGTYISFNTKLKNSLIGKYCSIGPNIKIISGKHPLSPFVSTNPMFYSTRRQNGATYVTENKYQELNFTSNEYNCEIGNDVWLGSDVKIMQGICIGDGAVVATGAVVTKNIPPYEVWGGVPAKKIKDRFTETQKEELLKIKWWNFDEAKIEKMKNDFLNIEIFLKKIKESDF